MTENIVYLEDIEAVVLAKYHIENELIEQGKITEKMSLGDFIGKFIKMTDNTAVYNMTTTTDVVPFFMYKTSNTIFIFFAEKNDFSEQTITKLKKINFDLSKLKGYESGETCLSVGKSLYEF